MSLRGAHRDIQPIGDLAVGQTGRDELRNLDSRLVIGSGRAVAATAGVRSPHWLASQYARVDDATSLPRLPLRAWSPAACAAASAASVKAPISANRLAAASSRSPSWRARPRAWIAIASASGVFSILASSSSRAACEQSPKRTAICRIRISTACIPDCRAICAARANRCLRLRPETDDLASLRANPERLLLAGVKMALRDLARRWKALDTEIKTLNQQIAALVCLAASELVELFGVGIELAGQFLVTAGDNPQRIPHEAAFAKLCGVAPQPASSGRTTGRHRLSRSGDRQANSALYIVTIVRMRHHEPTRAYVERRTNEGLNKREIIRCLKRYIAREIYANLPRPETNSAALTAAA